MFEDVHLKLREIEKEDYPQIKALMDSVYKDIGGAWPQHTIDKLIDDFPEGQIALFDFDKLIGFVLSVQVNYRKFSNPHTYDDLIGQRDTILNDSKGDAIYGLDALIAPDYRGYRLGRRLYDARKELCRQMNFRAILTGGRIPKYAEHSKDMTPGEYIDAVHDREIYDPALSFQLANGFIVKRVLHKYLPEDDKSKGFATLLEWNNIYYEAQDYKPNTRKTEVRIGGIQWQMREVGSAEELLQQVEFYIDVMADYHADFALLPEFFNAPLMGLCESTDQHIAIRYLASYTERFQQEISHMAVSYNVNVITGSMPLLEDDVLYNVSYLCRRDGTIEEQRKIHITPHERSAWVIEGGDKVQVFDTDAGRIGILICYDVEFPELARLQALSDMDILFVPFWTDTKNSYLRVRHCAQARAIENECYVMICGSVGNLPQVESLDIQYAQSSIFSPSDFPFPHDAIMAETTPNTEMIFFSDVNLDKLTHVRNEGSVHNLKDRRQDLFTLTWTEKERNNH